MSEEMSGEETGRQPVPKDLEAEILLKCARRCALCLIFDFDFSEKLGQIAHLDDNPANNKEDNLAFLCLRHHSLYDSTTSQHKNYTKTEVKEARQRLCEIIAQRSKIIAAQDDNPSLGPAEANEVELEFLNQEPFVVSTPTRNRFTGAPGPDRTYVRVFPKCRHPIRNCEAFLLAAYRWENDNWVPILNEACPLAFANRGIGPLIIGPLAGPYVDVFYIEQGNEQLFVCIPDHMKPLRLVGAFHRLRTYRFDVIVDGSKPIRLRVAPGTAWNRPLITVMEQ
jgi:hypothetical protein